VNFTTNTPTLANLGLGKKDVEEVWREIKGLWKGFKGKEEDNKW